MAEVVITSSKQAPTPTAVEVVGPRVAPKAFKNPKATHRVTHTALSRFSYGDEIAAGDLPKGASVEALVSLGALTPVGK